MAEEVVGSITTAVTAVVVDRAVSKILENFNQQTATAEQLQRLELLLIRIRSTIEVSQKRTIKSAALIQWQDKLKETASRGEEVLLAFQQRAADVDEAHGQQQEAVSSSSVLATGLSFTRKTLSDMARRVITAAIALFSRDEEVKKLDGAMEALEKEWENTAEFIALLQLEASKRRRTTYACLMRLQNHAAVPDQVDGVSLAERAGCQELQELVQRLERALVDISTSVEIVQRRDIKSLECLASWGDVLTEAKQQGCNVLDGVRAIVRKDIVECDLERDQLRRFVLTMESLAGDAEYFNKLVYLYQEYRYSLLFNSLPSVFVQTK